MSEASRLRVPSKTALITGIGGQDGAYLAQLLLGKGYKVFGASRDAGASRFDSLARIGVLDRVGRCPWRQTTLKAR